MRLAVIIPVYNEKATVVELVERVLATPPPAMPGDGALCERLLVLVDDGSDDGTTGLVMELATRPEIHAELHKRNQGKGAALRTGFAKAISLGADVLLVQDGDLEYSPDDHAAMIAPIFDGRADAVIGSRFLGQTHRVLYFWHSVANRIITLVCNMCTNLNLTDIECCLKAMTRDVAVKITIEEDRFGVEPEIVAKLSRLRRTPDGEIITDHAATSMRARIESEIASELGKVERLGGKTSTPPVVPLRIYEVPVSYAGRTYEEGKKITWRDGFSAMWCIVKYNLR